SRGKACFGACLAHQSDRYGQKRARLHALGEEGGRFFKNSFSSSSSRTRLDNSAGSCESGSALRRCDPETVPCMPCAAATQRPKAEAETPYSRATSSRAFPSTSTASTHCRLNCGG